MASIGRDNGRDNGERTPWHQIHIDAWPLVQTALFGDDNDLDRAGRQIRRANTDIERLNRQNSHPRTEDGKITWQSLLKLRAKLTAIAIRFNQTGNVDRITRFRTEANGYFQGKKYPRVYRIHEDDFLRLCQGLQSNNISRNSQPTVHFEQTPVARERLNDSSLYNDTSFYDEAERVTDHWGSERDPPNDAQSNTDEREDYDNEEEGLPHDAQSATDQRDDYHEEGHPNDAQSEGLSDDAQSEGLSDDAQSEGLSDDAQSEGLSDDAQSEGLSDDTQSASDDYYDEEPGYSTEWEGNEGGLPEQDAPGGWDANFVSLDDIQADTENVWGTAMTEGQILGYRVHGKIGYSVIVGHECDGCWIARLEPAKRRPIPEDAPHISKNSRARKPIYEDARGHYREYANRSHIAGLGLIAWRAEPDYLHDPTSVLRPQEKAFYPETYVQVYWKDKIWTWESRDGLRFVYQDAYKIDIMIYRMAIAQEADYQEALTGVRPEYPDGGPMQNEHWKNTQASGGAYWKVPRAVRPTDRLSGVENQVPSGQINIEQDTDLEEDIMYESSERFDIPTKAARRGQKGRHWARDDTRTETLQTPGRKGRRGPGIAMSPGLPGGERNLRAGKGIWGQATPSNTYHIPQRAQQSVTPLSGGNRGHGRTTLMGSGGARRGQSRTPRVSGDRNPQSQHFTPQMSGGRGTSMASAGANRSQRQPTPRMSSGRGTPMTPAGSTNRGQRQPTPRMSSSRGTPMTPAGSTNRGQRQSTPQMSGGGGTSMASAGANRSQRQPTPRMSSSRGTPMTPAGSTNRGQRQSTPQMPSSRGTPMASTRANRSQRQFIPRMSGGRGTPMASAGNTNRGKSRAPGQSANRRDNKFVLVEQPVSRFGGRMAYI